MKEEQELSEEDLIYVQAHLRRALRYSESLPAQAGADVLVDNMKKILEFLETRKRQ
jgi:hypothetical protein